MEAHPFNPCTLEAEPGWYFRFKASLNYIATSILG